MAAFTKNVRSVTGGQFTKIVKGIGGGGGGASSGDTNPISGTEVGDMFFNTTVDKLYVWNGTAWVDVT